MKTATLDFIKSMIIPEFIAVPLNDAERRWGSLETANRVAFDTFIELCEWNNHEDDVDAIESQFRSRMGFDLWTRGDWEDFTYQEIAKFMKRRFSTMTHNARMILELEAAEE